MNVVFREMRKADVGRVHEMECACFRTPWSKLSLMGELRNDIAVYLVAECNGIVAGYGGMWVLYDEAHVTNIAVMPDFRRNGIARALMLQLMEHAIARGATSMTLEVRESNLPAQTLYAQLGFVQNGFRPRYYTDTGEGAKLLWNTDIAKTVASHNKMC